MAVYVHVSGTVESAITDYYYTFIYTNLCGLQQIQIKATALFEGSIYDCNLSFPCDYYVRAITIQAVTVNQ